MAAESEIARWYRGKTVFITGATGFMGKVLLEKLLRSCPEIGPIYILVREKKDVLSHERVENMLTSDLFNELRNFGIIHGDRVHAIPGDVSLPELGISPEDRRLLQDTVSVVFHVAATVRFDEHLRLAVAMNFEGTKAVLQLCQGMAQLAAIVHVSTAYSNCDLSVIEERVYPPPANPTKVLQCVAGLDDDALDFVTPRLIYGHPNTYTFTKALAEDIVAKHSTVLPIVIVRPSIVAASWKEPRPGWVDNFNGPTALVVGAGKGLLTSIYGRKHVIVDMIPVDVCINLFIAAAWEMGTRKSSKLVSDIRVYNCVSGPFSPLTWNDFITHMTPCGTNYAMSDTISPPDIVMTSSRIRHAFRTFFYQSIVAHVGDFIIRSSGGKPKLKHYQQKLNHMVSLLEFFTTHEWEFKANNVKQLNDRLNSADQEIFGFDISKINWKDYVVSYYIGIKKNVLREEDDAIPAAQKRIAAFKFVGNTFKVGLMLSISMYLLRYYNLSKFRKIR
ncbi:putative fatty acyl-CoA reductase CG5065 isoform X1 [Neodiprion virginianus]|uniref:putative fatty acyl-CoA reductase CG5065 isoform X1 n=1 Tax=Neodiprion virginianus TaxID=2961670 RepID=UPI001EE6FE95|nr:putative fatty acyl-CoA reductase CG5065 isoform X1 [Neodiprion virginianus]XP_046616981.1 putative fatty acyl-CoA reductase CG5065 isoform X1 [Neodiprion virginianus]XP_046616982.1 putative fatty acyl-CoA reductase CG5065 isoform X1 [Neodiprion virginianus]XP_046616983.1 putative fatty acyl-CoA reductase CG5065 isoform X1 [Neodiprion virginianus]XP_046616984.1 putative fatty acyl-CoA reductase CG5065 isoform X1 [Neodiprion virginianus]